MTGTGTNTYDPLLLEKAEKIMLLVLDVDGVLTDGRLYYDQSGNELKSFHTRDGWGIKALQRCGVDVALITGRTSAAVTRRAQELNIDWVYQGAENKLDAFSDLLGRTDLVRDQVCYAGDDWVDIPVLERAGLSITVADANATVKSRVHWVTERGGGKGAVREICDLILVAKSMDQALLREILAT